MKIKTIEKILNNKFDAFTKSIKNKEIRNLVKESTLISGGCIASMCLNEDVNDYDLYFTDKETCSKVAQYFVDKFVKNAGNNAPKISVTDDDRVIITITSSGVAHYIQNSKTKSNYEPIFITSNAITLNNKIQLITRFYGDAEEIHKNFDYVHATNYWLSSTRKVYTNPKALESLLTKELKYIGSLYPVSSIFRLRKFIKRGFYINTGELLKIMWQVSKLDFEDMEVLKDQLLGVDIAYFSNLIDSLKSKQDITYDYLCKLIEEVF